MQTREIETPTPGMTIFSRSMNLMVEVHQVREDGFSFDVMNGFWRGRLKDGVITSPDVDYVISPKDWTPDFVEVVSVTPEEHHAWYMGGRSPARATPVSRDGLSPDDIESNDPAARILRAQLAQGLSTEALEAKSRAFLHVHGLAGVFADYLEGRASLEDDLQEQLDAGGEDFDGEPDF